VAFRPKSRRHASLHRPFQYLLPARRATKDATQIPTNQVYMWVAVRMSLAGPWAAAWVWECWARLSQSSPYVGMAFGYYGLAWSAYSSVIGRGAEVEFEKNANMEVKFGARMPGSHFLPADAGQRSR
jgi:hypothetical protein